MEHHKTTRKWSELYKLDVILPGEGKSLGKVEDFFFKVGTNAIYALSVRTRLHGDLTLPVTGIEAVEAQRVTVPNAEVLLKAVPAHPRGQSLLERKVVAENGKALGTIKDVILSVEPALTMRLSAFEMANGTSDHATKMFTADGVAGYADSVVAVDSYTAKKLR